MVPLGDLELNKGEKAKSVITIPFEERYKIRSLEPNHY